MLGPGRQKGPGPGEGWSTTERRGSEKKGAGLDLGAGGGGGTGMRQGNSLDLGVLSWLEAVPQGVGSPSMTVPPPPNQLQGDR